MKKFKSILALTASVLALSAFAAPVSAFADTTTTNENIEQTNSANLGVETSTPETYTVTIPANTVNFDNPADDRERTVTVSDVLLGANRQLTVTVGTTNGDDDNFMMANYTGSGTDRNYNNNKIAYTVSKEGVGIITPGAEIVTVSNLGDASTPTSLGAKLTFALPTGTTYPVAGSYADIMTFTIAVS